jgi:hypothetical protein
MKHTIAASVRIMADKKLHKILDIAPGMKGGYVIG